MNKVIRFKTLVLAFISTYFFFCSSIAQGDKKSGDTLTKEQRSAMIKQIITDFEIEAKVEQSISKARNFALKIIKKDVEAKLEQDMLNAALKKFDNHRANIKEEMLTESAKEIGNQFSDQEISYLASVSKFPVMKKVVKLTSSENLQNIFHSPFTKFAVLRDDSLKLLKQKK